MPGALSDEFVMWPVRELSGRKTIIIYNMFGRPQLQVKSSHQKSSSLNVLFKGRVCQIYGTLLIEYGKNGI